MGMSEFKINILHLYPDLLNLYGDKGNIECLKKRLIWRGIDVNIFCQTIENEKIDISDVDIIFIGGGTDKEQEMVCEKLRPSKFEIKEFVENGGTMIAVCGGYQFLGKYYQTEEKQIEGLGILDIYSEISADRKRTTGNAMVECDGISTKIVGFENHGGRMKIGNYKPLGKVIKGFGNDGESGYEGIWYKNLIGTYLHGPLFPKNPELCDAILLGALRHKYPHFTELPKLDDELETIANTYVSENY